MAKGAKMPIITLEGPDRCGKTTAYGWLKMLGLPVRFVDTPKLSVEMFEHIEELEALLMAFWDAIYDPSQVYICDRSLFFSGQVYAKLYGRKVLDIAKWKRKVVPIYLHCPIDILRQRCNRADDKFDSANYE